MVGQQLGELGRDGPEPIVEADGSAADLRKASADSSVEAHLHGGFESQAFLQQLRKGGRATRLGFVQELAVVLVGQQIGWEQGCGGLRWSELAIDRIDGHFSQL